MKIKIKKLTILAALLFVKQATACYIMDPTYDFAFKALFGESGGEEAKMRLVSFLNSILNESPFNIKINNIKYKNLEQPNINGNSLRFDVRCSCTKQVNNQKVNFEMDVEMQKAKQEDYFKRITGYSARLLDSYKGRRQKAPQQKVIIISILDCVLSNCENDVVFRVGNFKETLSGMTEEENGMITLIDETITHIGIQLPLYVAKIKAKEEVKYRNNPWLHLLGSRRITKGTDCKLVESGKYEYEDNLVIKNQSKEIKEAVEQLTRLANSSQPEYEEEIYRVNEAIMYDFPTIIAQKDKEITQKNDIIAQMENELVKAKEKLRHMQIKKALKKKTRKFIIEKEKKPKKARD